MVRYPTDGLNVIQVEAVSSKVQLTVYVLELLLETVKEKLIHVHYRSLAHLVESEMTCFVNSPGELPYNPMRLSASKKGQSISVEMFPPKRTIIRVHSAPFLVYKTALYSEVLKQYRLDTKVCNSISNRYAIEVLLWSGLRNFNIDLISSYFDDDDLLELINIEKLILQALMDVCSYLGRSPSARDYEAVRQHTGGPSLSLIKSHYGTFNNAKSKLGLDQWEWKGNKYF